MRSLWILVKLYVNSIFRFTVMRRSGDPRERRNAIMGVVAIGVITVTYGFMSVVYSGGLFLTRDNAEAPFLLMSASAALFVLVMAFAQGSATLSGFSDFDTLMSMPVRTSTVVLARFTALYLVEAIYAAAFLLPCGVLYAILRSPAFWFYPAYLLSVILLPVLPIVIGSGADLLLSVAFAKSKYKKGITSAFKTVFLLAFIAGSYVFPQITRRFLQDPESIAAVLRRVYPPADWFAKAATGSFPMFLLFSLGSIALCTLFVLVLNKTFLPLHDRLSAGYHVKNYRLTRQRRRSVGAALLEIECKRFFNSTAWVLNTIIGAILILAAGVAALIFSGRLTALLDSLGITRFAPAALIGILIFCATIAPTTSCAISMEGRQIWISKHLPIPAKDWLRAKLWVNLLLVGPALLIAATLSAIAFRAVLAPLNVVGLFALPVCALLANTVFGLFINAKMPRLSWKAETEVVKQSAAVLVSMLAGFLLVAVAVVPTLLIGSPWVPLALCAVILIPTVLIYAQMMRNAEQIRTNL